MGSGMSALCGCFGWLRRITWRLVVVGCFFGVGIGAEEGSDDPWCERAVVWVCDIAAIFDVGGNGDGSAVAISEAE